MLYKHTSQEKDQYWQLCDLCLFMTNAEIQNQKTKNFPGQVPFTFCNIGVSLTQTC